MYSPRSIPVREASCHHGVAVWQRCNEAHTHKRGAKTTCSMCDLGPAAPPSPWSTSRTTTCTRPSRTAHQIHQLAESRVDLDWFLGYRLLRWGCLDGSRAPTPVCVGVHDLSRYSSGWAPVASARSQKWRLGMAMSRVAMGLRLLGAGGSLAELRLGQKTEQGPLSPTDKLLMISASELSSKSVKKYPPDRQRSSI